MGEEEDQLTHSTAVQSIEIDESLTCDNNLNTNLPNTSSANIRSTTNNNKTASSAKTSLRKIRQDLHAMSVASIYINENEFEEIE